MLVARQRCRLTSIENCPRTFLHPKSGEKRRGSLTLELLFVLPIILILILAMVQFGMTLHAQQQLTAASREGCRVAACGGSSMDVENRIRDALGNGRLSDADILITGSHGSEVDPVNDVMTGDAVAVWVRLPMNHAVPDLLRFIGYSIKEDELIARTVMRRE